MKKHAVTFMIVIVFIFASVMVSYTGAEGDCGSNCSSQCDHLGSGPEWAKCMENCLRGCLNNNPPNVPPVPSPTPVKPSGSKSDLKNFNSNSYVDRELDEVNTPIVVVSVYDDNDQPCYVGGKYVGNCSRNKPYYNAFNGECYRTLQECGGSSSCVRCGR
jgi:hypothetical protein